MPGLASSWQVSPDGLVYTFALRQDVKFHDGSQFNAESVASNIQRIFDPEMPASKARTLLGALQQYEILDEYTIRLYLSAPYGAFLDALAQPYLGMASSQAVVTYDGLRYQFHQSGTGPFQLEEYLPGERIILRRFPGYTVLPTIYAPLTGEEIDRVEFLLTREPNADALTLLDGTFDIIDDIAPIEGHRLAGNSRVQILPIDIAGQTVQFVFNTNRPPLNNREIRLALLLATNRIAISNLVYFNFSSVAWAPLSESTGFAHTGYINQFSYDLDLAQELLSAAGYLDSDGDGILDRDGNPLELKILVPPWGQLPEVAAFLSEQWRSIGINLKTEPVPGKTRLTAFIESGEYDLLPVENYGIDPALLNHVFLDDSSYRASRAPNQQLNDWLLEAAQEIDPTLRRNRYYEIQALLMNEVLILPVRENLRMTAARALISNLRFDAYGFYPLLFNVSISES